MSHLHHELPLPPNHRQDIKPSYVSLPAGFRLMRLSMPKWAEYLFNPKGPEHRFDHHPKGPYQEHSGYGVCYLAKTLESCIAEICLTTYAEAQAVNGHLNSGRLQVEVETTRALELLDLCDDGPLKAGTRQGILDEYQTRAVTQAWARRFYLNPYSEYQPIDGIQWPSAKNGQMVYALYERAQDGISIVRQSEISKQPLKRQVMRICANYRIIYDD